VVIVGMGLLEICAVSDWWWVVVQRLKGTLVACLWYGREGSQI
jgi:hypothetical protein